VDRSAFAHCTVALKQAQRGWYIHRLLQNFLRRFSSLAGVLQTPTRARPRNKKVSFDLPRNYLRAGRSRSGHARHLRSDALHFPNVHAPRFQRPSDAASGSKKARSVAKRGDGAPTSIPSRLARARTAHARVTTRSHRDVTKIALIFKENLLGNRRVSLHRP